MGRKSLRAVLVLDDETARQLGKIYRSRTQPTHMVERAGVLLGYAQGKTVTQLVKQCGLGRLTIERTVDRALQLGPVASLQDRPGRGRKPRIDDDARAWLLSVACTKPTELGYPDEIWSTRTLAAHAQQHGPGQGHPCLGTLARGTVSKLLAGAQIRPHKIDYYLERRDPEFDAKMAQVLTIYRQVQLLQPQVTPQGVAHDEQGQAIAVLSVDEKPGVQAIKSIAPELPPKPGKYKTRGRDYEYKRLGTLSLLAGLDLMTGKVFAQIHERHRSVEFISLLKSIDQAYPEQARIVVIADNHSAHISKETQAYLQTRPNRFAFTFTPKHGSWLNLVEVLFAKMTKTLLRGIRVSSKAELAQRIQQYVDDINADPVVFRWKYGLAESVI